MKPGLYGIINSNRDMTQKKHWGKNEFTNSFPVAVANYMNETDRLPVYVCLDDQLNVIHKHISMNNAFNYPDSYKSNDIYFDFESVAEEDRLLNGKGEGNSTRSDIVIWNKQHDKCYRGMELKLTVVPDNTTKLKPHDEQGPELVIRPVSILHLSNLLASYYADNPAKLYQLLNPVTRTFTSQEDWLNEGKVIAQLEPSLQVLENILKDTADKQIPILMQCIWRTEGVSPRLDENAFDIFFWSTHAFTKLFLSSINIDQIIKKKKLDRKTRSLVWIIRMLNDFVSYGKIKGEELIHTLSFGNQTDKAFAASGRKTLDFLAGTELSAPRVRREEVENIILGNGQKMLSPERRLDASLFFETSLH